ncbi:protein NO VEIN domain-containing protein [Parvibaculum sp.]|uniref:protein NO VEIN domain-containing protein n=1 Tax=Parvibaculum sp. TaxID=2024848 RepID=UPI00351DED26
MEIAASGSAGADGGGAGYDILSFTARGEERFLEVKTTCLHLATLRCHPGTCCRGPLASPSTEALNGFEVVAPIVRYRAC